MKVLVTGGAGSIGQIVRRYLGQDFELRLLDRAEVIPADAGMETLTADLNDINVLRQACEGMDAVIHLAAVTDSRLPWKPVLENNLIGTGNLFEAARLAGVKRIVFASSHWASAYAVQDEGIAGPEPDIRPFGHYGVSKIFGEALGRFFVDAYAMSVICLRIGSCHQLPDPAAEKAKLERALQQGPVNCYTAEQHIGIWVSDRDMAQALRLALITERAYGVYYVASDNHPPTLDISRTREELGYAPQDSVNDFVTY